MILNRTKYIIITVFSILFFICLFSSIPFASEISSVKVTSVSGEKFIGKVLLDITGGNDIRLEIGSKLDYKLMRAVPPFFLEALYINIPPNLYEGEKRIAYVLTKKSIEVREFPLVLKLFVNNEKPSVKRFDIALSVDYNPSASDEGQERERGRKKINLGWSGIYRHSERDINIAGGSKTSKTTLALARYHMSFFEDRFDVFFDLGSGILKVEDLLFDGFLPQADIPIFDGGRGFAFGGGVKGKVFDSNNIRVEIGGNVTRFTDEAEVISKPLTRKIEAEWLEYNGDLVITYTQSALFQPFIGVSFSKVDGDLKLTQTTVNSTKSQTKEFDEKDNVGVRIGMEIMPLKDVTIIGEARLLNETGFMAGLRWMFMEF